MQHPTMIRDVMSTPVVCLDEHTLVSKALELASLHALHHFPVTHAEQTIGLVCTCDLRWASPDTTVQRWMRTPLVTVSIEGSAEEAARLMVAHVVGSAVVTTGTRVQGIVTREDLEGVSEELDELMRDTRCSSCGVQRHLRRGGAGLYWCANCRDRSGQDGWYDVGGGD